MTKTCKKCRVSKPLENFYRNNQGRDGYQARCKACFQAKLREVEKQPKPLLQEKRCGRCHVVKPSTAFGHRRRLVSGLSSSCKECTSLDRKTPTQLFGAIRNSAQQRGLSFDLTYEEFSSFTGKPCHYCGDPLRWVSLDRTRSSEGYTSNNLLPCCSRCNYCKRVMDPEEWYHHIEKVLRHQGRI